MKLTLLFGSYREPSNGRRLLHYLQKTSPSFGFEVATADAKAIGLPLLDKKYEEYEAGKAPQNMVSTSKLLSDSDAYIMIAGEYNASLQPGLANLMSHFLPEYNNKPIGFATYSPGALGGARVSMILRPFVANLGMVSIPSVLGVGAIHEAISEEGNLLGDAGKRIETAAAGFLKQLTWYAEALKKQRG